MNTQLNNIPFMKTGLLGFALLLSSAFLTVQAANYPYANIPLFYANGVQPNVALIIDNSSSMTNTDTGGSGKVSNTCTTGSNTAPLTRLQAAENAACQVINDNASSMRIGLWDFTTSTAGAVQINDFGAATAAQMNTSINGFVANSDGTPLSSAMLAAMTAYFGSSSPIQYRCQKNFVVLFTDGSADVGIDENSSITLPSLNNSTQQASTWSGATTVKTGGTMTSPGWDGFTDPDISWLYPTTNTYYTYYTWLDDLSQMGYDVDIKDGTSAKPTAAFCGNPTGVTLSAGSDCAGKNWDGSNDTTANAALYKKQNVITYTIGFGDESNNEVMRDTPLVNQISISPSQVNLSADTITVTNHGLSTGAYVHYYQTPSVVAYKGPGDSSAESITVASTTPASYTAPDTGTSLTYSNGGGTTQQYNVSSTGTYTCGSVGGLTSGNTYYVSTANLATNTFELASTKGGAAINLTSIGTTGVLLSFSRAAVAPQTSTTANLNTSGTTPINTTGTITLAAHGFSTGDYVTYTCSSTGTKCPTGITSGNSYYILAATASTFQLSSTFGGSVITLTRPTATTATATFVRAAVTADAPPGVIAGATGSITPINTTTEVITVPAHGFSAYNAVTYSCANQTYPITTPTNLPSPVYSVYVDSTHFKLASSLANALAGTTLDLSNTGNANQTFSQTNKVTIGGLFPYATDAPAATATGVAPTYSSSSPSNAEGKYYVEVIDANTIKLHQCGVTEVLTGHPLYCALQVATAVNFTSTGYGTLSTGPGLFYAAVDAATLSADLQAAFLSISGQSLSQASLTVNSAYYSSGSAYAYLTSFNTSNWSGDIKAYAISSTDGSISTSSSWTASQEMPGSASRNLITATAYNTAGAGAIAWPISTTTTAGVQGAGITTSEQTGLGLGSTYNPDLAYVVQWVAGSDTTGLSGSRTRGSNGVIGDILNGSPVYVGPPSGTYNTTLPLGAADQSSYAAFKTAQASRTPMLYVGANDGMLHGFNASTGVESFGFIPAGVYTDSDATNDTNKFYDLTQTGYGYVSTKPHHYFVDGPPYEGDAYYSSAWHSVVVGGLGKGGKSIYALDVTNPTSFTKSNVLWEFNDTANIGYTFGQPTIARVQNGAGNYVWAAIFANGYNATGNVGYLYVVNISTGSLIGKIATTAAGGLSTATVYTATSGAYQGDATYAYAGDMLGNVWRFNLTNPSPSNWTASILFSAKAGANPQPITTAPVVIDATAVPYSLSQGLIVVVGTGTYFQTSDANYTVGTTTPAYDSLYSIWDEDYTTTVTSASLQQQTITTAACTGSSYANCRVVSSNTPTPPNYFYQGTGVGSRGWYINLYADASTSENGERIAYKPLQIGYILVFSTVVPQNTDPCTGGGTSWFYAIDATTGASASAFVDANGNAYTFSGVESTAGVLSQGTYEASTSGGTNGTVNWLGSTSSAVGISVQTGCGAVKRCNLSPISTFTVNAGRMTWRQLQ